MRVNGLQMFKHNSSVSIKNLAKNLTVFRKSCLKPHSLATAKHKLQRPVFNPRNQKLIVFLNELAKDAFGGAAQVIKEQIKYAMMPPHLKKSINQAYSENITCEPIVWHHEKELELNGLEAPDD